MKSYAEGIKPAVTCAKNSSNPETEKTSQTLCLPSLHDHLKHFKSSVGLKKIYHKILSNCTLGRITHQFIFLFTSAPSGTGKPSELSMKSIAGT